MHTDHLNSPRKVSRPSDNALEWRWDADPFGTASPDQNPASLGTFVYNFRDPGQYYIAETGLNQNWNRDYDPVVGRYVEADPIGLLGGINPYVYVSGNPIWSIDPLGLTQCDIDVAKLIAMSAHLRLSSGEALAYPSSYGDLGLVYDDQGRLILGDTIPGYGTGLSSLYQAALSNPQAADLLNTIIHEAVHWTLPANDPRQGDESGTGYAYSEATRLTTPSLIKKLNRERKKCKAKEEKGKCSA